MKKILVIGVKGMAGHVIFRRFQKTEKYVVFGIARNIHPMQNVFDLDVSDTVALRKIITENSFDTIINCIGILNKDAESNPAKAIWFNSYFPHFLEEITRDRETKIIHISTDCVFSGKKGAYTEHDLKDGVGFYAQSKSLGEIDNEKDVTLRTSIIGPELNENGIGLFHWFMTQSITQPLNGFTEAYWSGVTTIELSKVIEEIIERQNLNGILQIAPKNKIDKYSLLQIFNDVFKEDKMVINKDNSYSVDKSLVSVRNDFEYSIPDYRDMLIEMREWINGEKVYSY